MSCAHGGLVISLQMCHNAFLPLINVSFPFFQDVNNAVFQSARHRDMATFVSNVETVRENRFYLISHEMINVQ